MHHRHTLRFNKLIYEEFHMNYLEQIKLRCEGTLIGSNNDACGPLISSPAALYVVLQPRLHGIITQWCILTVAQSYAEIDAYGT